MKRPEDWTVIKLLEWATSYFESHGIESPRLDAELLLAFALEAERIDLYLRYDQPLNPEELGRFRALVKRRRVREPVAYIVGRKAFWTLDLIVGPDVLIPRPETECLVEAVLAFWKARDIPGEGGRFLDIGTGSGAIALALAQSCPRVHVVAADRSPGALAVADINRRRHGLDSRVALVAADWLDVFSVARARFDIIVSNPPYIPTADIPGLQPEIVRHEPRTALDGGCDGLDGIRRLVFQAPALLRPGGALFIEIAHDQFPAVQKMARDRGGYDRVECRQDYSGHDRVACLTTQASKDAV